MPRYDVFLTTTYGYSKNYDQLQGTSMSAPQVAGLAALLFAQDPSRTNAQVRAIIETTTDDLDKPGWDRSTGFGRINILRALGTPPDDGGGDAQPTVSVTNPGANTTVSGTVDVTADAGDDVGVDEVEFFVDAASLGVDMDGSDGWSRPWDTTTYADGTSHSVTATAKDTIGQTKSDIAGNVTVDNGGGGGGGGDMYVSAIAFTQKNFGRGGAFHDIITTVTIGSGDGAVSAASVLMTLCWDGTTGNACWDFGGDSDGSGQVKFTLKHAPDGDYTASVTNVTHATYSYYAGLDIGNPAVTAFPLN
jgi:hypothetical protein